MKINKYFTFALVILYLSACLKLQKNEKFDTNGDYWGKYTLNQWLNSDSNKDCSIFAEAVDMTGMAEIFSSIEPSTVIIPNDEAFEQLFSEMGINNISEFEPVVLREILSYLVLSQKYISTDLRDGVVVATQNLLDKPLYLTKKPYQGNTQALHINSFTPSGTESFSATTASVVMQDLIFKDHVAQITSNVPYYREYTLKTDVYKGEPDTDEMLDIKTVADTYLDNIRTESPYDRAMHCNSERLPIILYENIESVDFYNDISVARVSFYVPEIRGDSTNPFVLYDISDEAWELTNEGSDISKFYQAVYKDYVPTMTPENMVASFDFDEAGKWTTVDITEYILKHFNKTAARPIAFTIVPASKYYTTGILYLGFKKESNNDMTNNPSYIRILGRVDSKILLQNSNDITCDESVYITKDDLLCTAPVVPDGLIYSPQNIIYRIINAPSGGVITRNCLPLKEGDVFTQEEINVKAIKYYKTTAELTDEFTLRAGDYSGATLPEIIKMNVSIK